MRVLGIGCAEEYNRVENGHWLVLLEQVLGGFMALFPEPEARQGSLEPFSFERGDEDSFRVGNGEDLVPGSDLQKFPHFFVEKNPVPIVNFEDGQCFPTFSLPYPRLKVSSPTTSARYASPSLFIIDENGIVRYRFVSKEAEFDYPKDDELLSRISSLG